jgi:hypothetical protein
LIFASIAGLQYSNKFEFDVLFGTKEAHVMIGFRKSDAASRSDRAGKGSAIATTSAPSGSRSR